MRIKATVWAGFASVLVLAVITALAYESIRQTFETNQRATLDGLVDEVRAQISHVGRMVSAEAELIAELARRDIPFYVASISRGFVAGMTEFQRNVGLLRGDVAYEDVVATEFSALWNA